MEKGFLLGSGLGESDYTNTEVTHTEKLLDWRMGKRSGEKDVQELCRALRLCRLLLFTNILARRAGEPQSLQNPNVEVGV